MTDRLKSGECCTYGGYQGAHAPWCKTNRPERRSDSQSRKFHAICRDFARSRIKWAGKERDETQWKVLLVSGHTVATGGQTEVVAGLEGEFIQIRESTASMSKSRGSSLIEYCLAMASHMGVRLNEYEGMNPEKEKA
jgi:hypothetical protein